MGAVFQDEEQLKIFSDYYEVYNKGNWEDSNILHRRKSAEKVAEINGISVEKLNEVIVAAKAKLMKAREKRIRPGLDDKVLTSWNALMLKGYVDAYKAFGKAEYLETAVKNGEFF